MHGLFCPHILVLSIIAAAVAAPPVHGQSTAAVAAPPGQVVYHNDFSAPVGAEWSHKKISQTPKGQRKFLGQFVEEPVTLTLQDLPPHQLLRVTLDLFLIRSWDGSSTIWGTKIWDMAVVGGPTLIHSTFSNCGFFSDNNEQSFPDLFPCKPWPAWTGAAEHQTLGYIQSWGGPERTFDTDSVYHFVLTFPAQGKSVALRFTSIMEKYKDKGWGLANVQVETLAAPLVQDRKVLEKWWNDLAGADPVAAFSASWGLIAAGDQTVDFIQQQQGASADEKVITQLISQLDDDLYAVRARATEELRRQRTTALPRLRQAWAQARPGERRSRLEDIIAGSGAGDWSTEEWRRQRAGHVLQVIHTPAALRLRAALGAPEEATTPQAGKPAAPTTPPEIIEIGPVVQ